MSSRQHYPLNPTPFPSAGAYTPTNQAMGLFASQARRIYINLSRYAIEYLEHTGRARDNDLLHHLMEQALYTAVINGSINEPMHQEILRLMGRYLAGGRPRTTTTTNTAMRNVTVIGNSTTDHASSNQHQENGGTKEQEEDQKQEKQKQKEKEIEVDEGSNADDAVKDDVSDTAAGSATTGPSKRTSNRRSRNHKPGTSLVGVLAQMPKRDM